ncbi:MAG: flavin reductase family protein [Candidatus Muiribacteriota bacterium]
MNKKTLHKINYGLYIASAGSKDKFNGCIVNTVFQITAEPITLCVSVNRENYTNKFIKKAGNFTVSILSEKTEMPFIGRFGFRSGKDIDKFSKTEHKITELGNPVVTENTVGFLEVKTTDILEVGTHTLFIGELVDAEIFNGESPMTYSYYHDIKGGKTPQKAATYIKSD